MKISSILRADNSGLGTLSREFYDNLGFEKALLVDNGKYKSFPNRFPKARRVTKIKQADIDWLLTDVDVFLAFETPYNWDIFSLARKRNVKTVLMPMYECEPYPLPAFPDLILCPSKLDYRIFRSEVKGRSEVVYLPVPINRDRVRFKPRNEARIFQHNAGHGGLVGRNGTTELLAAIPMLKSDAKVLIYSQKKIDFVHPKVEVRVGNFENYWDLWGEGDVFVFPHKFDGLSLPIQEALSSGMPVLSTLIFPFTKWLPNDWFFPASEFMNLRVWDRFVEVAVIPPEEIAASIDAWYGKNILKQSEIANQLAEELSWKKLRPKYLELFKNLIA